MGPLYLTKEMAARYGQAGVTRRPPAGDDGNEAVLGLGQGATQPLGQGHMPPDPGVQHPLALTDLGSGPRREDSRALGVAA